MAECASEEHEGRWARELQVHIELAAGEQLGATEG